MHHAYYVKSLAMLPGERGEETGVGGGEGGRDRGLGRAVF